MARSVSYVGDNVVFFDCDTFDDIDWGNMRIDIASALQQHYPSFNVVDKRHDRENHVFLENYHVQVSCAEYCGLGSISVFVNPIVFEYSPYDDILAKNWLGQCWPGIRKIIGECLGIENTLTKLGHFSNGEGAYERANGKKVCDKYRED